MPLVVATLAKQIEAVFISQPSSGAVAAQKLAMAYDTYCKTALAGGVPPFFTTAEVKALEGILASALASPNGAAATMAKAWSEGIQAYWTIPPVQFLAPPIIGMVSGIPGALAAIPAITATLTNTKNTEATAAQQMADALDVATKTVLVTFTAPPPPSGPPPPATVV